MNEIKHARYFLNVKSIVFPSPALQISGESSWSACPVSPSCRPPQTGHSQRPRGGGTRPPHPPMTSPHKGFNKWWSRSLTNDGAGTAWVAATGGGFSSSLHRGVKNGQGGVILGVLLKKSLWGLRNRALPIHDLHLELKSKTLGGGWRIWQTFCLHQLARRGIWYVKTKLKSPSPYSTRSQPIGFSEKQNAILHHWAIVTSLAARDATIAPWWRMSFCSCNKGTVNFTW